MVTAASHAADKGREPDAVFATLKRANDAIAALGKDKVVNATIGALYDEEERFATLTKVSEHYRSLPDEELMNYAPIAGLPEFLQAAIDYTFQGQQPAGVYIKAVATPGGTGAIRHAFYNYLEQGQKALIPDWFWGPYRTIANEHGRDVATYQLFDNDFNFNLASVGQECRKLLAAQDNLVVLFNTPGHNPTGYSMTEQDWNGVLDLVKSLAADVQKRITIVVDMAYIDFAGPAQETRKFMKLFGNLPENVLVTIAFSMSKSFAMYGMRSGALIGLSSSEKAVEEFSRINAYSNRGVWSNGARGAQRLLADVMKNPGLKAEIDRERAYYSGLLRERADVFLKEAKEVGLVTLPYRGGFFITIPCDNPKTAAEKLEKDNIFVVPLKKGLRFAICGLPTAKIPGLAAKTKRVI